MATRDSAELPALRLSPGQLSLFYLSLQITLSLSFSLIFLSRANLQGESASDRFCERARDGSTDPIRRERMNP